MVVFKKLVEIGAKMLDILDNMYVSPIPDAQIQILFVLPMNLVIWMLR